MVHKNTSWKLILAVFSIIEWLFYSIFGWRLILEAEKNISQTQTRPVFAPAFWAGFQLSKTLLSAQISQSEQKLASIN